MRIGLQLGYGNDFLEAVRHVSGLEKAGLEMVSVAEAYSFDAVSQLGYLAAATERAEITSGVLQLFSRTPTLLAMTAAGLDYVSGGRFTLGLGASGPQVVEGFHGVRYDSPLARTRETLEICRQLWRREKVVHSGRHYQVPLPESEGTGLGKPLKMIDRPVRERIPVSLAALGPRNVALTAEIAEGWEPIFYHPFKAQEIWADSLAEGYAKRAPELGELDITVGVPVAFAEGADAEEYFDAVRPQLALYIGGMGARGKNFYHDLACRYGYAESASAIQDHYLAGRKNDAAATVPDELVRAVSLIGPRSVVAEGIAALRAAGVTTLKAHLLSPDPADHVSAAEQLAELAA
jgi:F420-dependent oxidoreductase-like protein